MQQQREEEGRGGGSVSSADTGSSEASSNHPAMPSTVMLWHPLMMPRDEHRAAKTARRMSGSRQLGRA